MVIENNSFSLAKLVNGVVTDWKERMNWAKLTLEANFDLDGELCFGDEKRILEIFNHILGNCLLNSEESSTVRVFGTVEKEGTTSFYYLLCLRTGDCQLMSLHLAETIFWIM